MLKLCDYRRGKARRLHIQCLKSANNSAILLGRRPVLAAPFPQPPQVEHASELASGCVQLDLALIAVGIRPAKRFPQMLDGDE